VHPYVPSIPHKLAHQIALCTGLFNDTEVRSIVKARTQFEYTLLRPQLRVEHLLEYLEYELNLFQLLCVRRKRLRLRRAAAETEKHTSKHISHVFERGIRRFPKDTRLWNAYMDFLEKSRNSQQLSAVCTRALLLLPRHEAFWIRAATHEAVERRNPHGARVLLQRALRINKASKPLFLFYFRQELLEVLRLRERCQLRSHPLHKENDPPSSIEGAQEHSMSSENTHAHNMFTSTAIPSAPAQTTLSISADSKAIARAKLLRGEIPLLVLEHALENVPADLHFALQLFEVARAYRVAEVNTAVLHRLMKDFANEPHMYLHVAQTALEEGQVHEALRVLQKGCEHIDTKHMRCESAQLLLRTALSAHTHVAMQHLLSPLQTFLDELFLKDSDEDSTADVPSFARIALLKAEYATVCSNTDTRTDGVQRIVDAYENVFEILKPVHQQNTQLSADEALSVCRVLCEALRALQRLAAWTKDTSVDGCAQKHRRQVSEICVSLRRPLCCRREGSTLLLRVLEEDESMHMQVEEIFREVLQTLCTMDSIDDKPCLSVHEWSMAYVRRSVRAGRGATAAYEWLARGTLVFSATGLAHPQLGARAVDFFILCIDAMVWETALDAQRETICAVLEEGLRVCRSAASARAQLYERLAELHIETARVDLAGHVKWRAQKEGLVLRS
jgi:hypothetical protein